jgi:hypothetical protein
MAPLDTIRIAQDPTMPKGRCVVIVDSEIVYAGRIGRPVIPFMHREGALMILNPEDFADGEAYMKAQTQLN